MSMRIDRERGGAAQGVLANLPNNYADLPLSVQLELLLRPRFVVGIALEEAFVVFLYIFAARRESLLHRGQSPEIGKLVCGITFAALAGITGSQTFLLGKCWFGAA